LKVLRFRGGPKRKGSPIMKDRRRIQRKLDAPPMRHQISAVSMILALQAPSGRRFKLKEKPRFYSVTT
jgi:hypothetical protein